MMATLSFNELMLEAKFFFLVKKDVCQLMISFKVIMTFKMPLICGDVVLFCHLRITLVNEES